MQKTEELVNLIADSVFRPPRSWLAYRVLIRPIAVSSPQVRTQMWSLRDIHTGIEPLYSDALTGAGRSGMF